MMTAAAGKHLPASQRRRSMTTHFDNELCFRSRFFRAMQGQRLLRPVGLYRRGEERVHPPQLAWPSRTRTWTSLRRSRALSSNGTETCAKEISSSSRASLGGRNAVGLKARFPQRSLASASRPRSVHSRRVGGNLRGMSSPAQRLELPTGALTYLTGEQRALVCCPINVIVYWHRLW